MANKILIIQVRINTQLEIFMIKQISKRDKEARYSLNSLIALITGLSQLFFVLSKRSNISLAFLLAFKNVL
jgi:hypothetical protein